MSISSLRRIPRPFVGILAWRRSDLGWGDCRAKERISNCVTKRVNWWTWSITARVFPGPPQQAEMDLRLSCFIQRWTTAWEAAGDPVFNRRRGFRTAFSRQMLPPRSDRSPTARSNPLQTNRQRSRRKSPIPTECPRSSCTTKWSCRAISFRRCCRFRWPNCVADPIHRVPKTPSTAIRRIGRRSRWWMTERVEIASPVTTSIRRSSLDRRTAH